MDIKSYKCINFLDTLYALQETECNELKIPVPPPGSRTTLPDGRDDIFQRLWHELMQDQWGNQQFTNDCFYRVPFEYDENDNVCTDDLSDDMKLLLEYCREAINEDDSHPFILFSVSW